MEKYKALIGKRINVVLNDEVITHYDITMINPNPVQVEGLGECYRCACNWAKNAVDPGQYMDFDVNTLEDLLTKGRSQSPIMEGMYFEITSVN